jgi:SAM-dependent methyltransferase
MTNPLRANESEALAEWSRRVHANREQVNRFREVEDGTDFYGPIAARFEADPQRRDDLTLDVLLALAQPDETWLDVGAGGGRYALPLAMVVREVVALDPSAGMLEILRSSAAKHNISNVRIVQDRWPLAEPVARLGSIDVALIAHVGYDIADIGPFLQALEEVATSRCVAVMLDRPPAADANLYWPEIHGEERAALPALPEFLALQLARGRLCDVRIVPLGASAPPDLDHELAFARRQTWVRPGSAKDRQLEQLVRARRQARNGGSAAVSTPLRVGIVSWRPA